MEVYYQGVWVSDESDSQSYGLFINPPPKLIFNTLWYAVYIYNNMI